MSQDNNEAASASQSSTTGAAKGGTTNADTPELREILNVIAAHGDITNHDITRLSDYFLAHVARQRQESAAATSKCFQCACAGDVERCDHIESATPSAAVAEGVDTPEFRELLAQLLDAAEEAEKANDPILYKPARDKFIAHLTTYGAQQREAGRLEERAIAFDHTAECSPMLTRCPRCKNPHNSCDATLSRQPVSEGLTEAQRRTATELLACFMSWEPQVLVLGNVRADDSANLLRSILSAAPPAKAEGMSDTERLDFITTFGEPWTVQWEKRGAKPVRYRMINDGEPWGQWHASARAAIDAAILAQQAQGGA